jgi:hypothetical protein
MLRCAYCGAMREVPPGPAHSSEHALADGLRAAAQPLPAEAAASGGAALRCAECGAQVWSGSGELAAECGFCGTASVVPVALAAVVRPLQPDLVLPFCIDKRAAAGAFSRWLRRLWLRPGNLRQLATLCQLQGIYLPFWSFSSQVESQWTAEAGRYYYVDEQNYTVLRSPGGGNGPLTDGEDGGPGIQGGPELPRRAPSRRRVRKTRWREAAGQRSDVFADVLVCASHGLKGALADRLKSYNLRRLLPYADGYLAGFAAEAYAVELGDGHARARTYMDAAQSERCARDVGGDTHRNLVVRNRYRNETYRYALLPVWIATYRYRSQVYRFVVSGQTAEVSGQAPYSVPKVTAACLLGLAVVLLFLYLQYRQPELRVLFGLR